MLANLVSKRGCSFRNVLVQTLKNGALRQGAAAVAALGQCSQSFLHSLERPNLLIDIGDLCLRTRTDIGTFRPLLHAKSTDIRARAEAKIADVDQKIRARSEEHTSELQSHLNLVCRLL